MLYGAYHTSNYCIPVKIAGDKGVVGFFDFLPLPPHTLQAPYRHPTGTHQVQTLHVPYRYPAISREVPVLQILAPQCAGKQKVQRNRNDTTQKMPFIFPSYDSKFTVTISDSTIFSTRPPGSIRLVLAIACLRRSSRSDVTSGHSKNGRGDRKSVV